MKYFSLNGAATSVSFRDAVLQGQAPDGGLYFPASVPRHDATFWSGISGMDDREIGLRILGPYVDGDLAENVLAEIVAETLSFPLPLVPVAPQRWVLELFHGPTLAFKDIGAGFMSRCLGRFAREAGRRVVVLVATSGDTGGAVANSFHNVPGVDVVVLYPSGKVSPVQERQIAALGGNVHALEVSGDFDDCQALVKQAFADADLRSQVYLTSANSINVARWLPQQLYYALAWKAWPDKKAPPVLSVPSGNFGNIGAGLLLQRSGLPVKRFVAACNANDAVPEFLEQGHFVRRPSVATLSNAMDVADPSNFVRILRLFNNDLAALRLHLQATRSTDADTRATIRRVHEKYGYVLDPHSAVAWHGLDAAAGAGVPGIVVSTAHPVKFPAVVEEETGAQVPYPDRVRELMEQPLRAEAMPPEYGALRASLLRFR
ncbi:MAG: threonine synthase [Chitinophagaceae bacterium]|nr:MAG: threonine synthase [Chitinophagaceae bacterium]